MKGGYRRVYGLSMNRLEFLSAANLVIFWNKAANFNK